MVLLWSILASVATFAIESVPEIADRYRRTLIALEWLWTGLFTLEYLARLYAVRRPVAYARSFFGVVDLLSIAPTYLSLLVPGAQALAVVRILRLLRVFRVLKLTAYLEESAELVRALRASQRKISVFLLTVCTIVVIVGSLMFLIEGNNAGFSDIPTSVYWAIVTLTTVGYGDIAPVTPLGRFLASCLTLLGYGVIAVPTGIISAELTRGMVPRHDVQSCPHCGAEGHQPDARHCRTCGGLLK